MARNLSVGPSISSNSYINSILLPFSPNLNVCHLNCQSIKPSINYSKFDELKLILKDFFIDIFAVSETWLKPYISSCAV